MTALDQAKNSLLKGECTCVLSNGEKGLFSTKRGVKPLLEWLDTGEDFSSFYAADKVVGMATAFLYVLLKVQGVYARVISKRGVQVLKNNAIFVEYEDVVENIINRKGDGVCPIESAVAVAKTSKEAYELIIATLAKLSQV